MLRIEKLLIISFVLLKSYLNVEGRGEVYETKFYYCNDTTRIQYDWFCDGEADCGAGDDEPGLAGGEWHPFAEWHNCTNSENSHDGLCLVSRDQICNGIVSCSNLSPCDLKCESHYKCMDGSCYLRTSVCDNNPCTACTEDHEWSNGVGFKCVRSGKTCVLPQQLLHDDIADCDGGLDICFQNLTAMSRNERQSFENLIQDKCFQCFDQSMIIRSTSVCDEIIDCPDLSDECFCEDKKPAICDQIITPNNYKDLGLPTAFVLRANNYTDNTYCKIGDIRCKNGSCIGREKVCDGIKHCDEDESESICGGTLACKDATKQEKCRCVVGHDISCRRFYGISCNGLAECPPQQDPGYVINTLWEHPEDECDTTCSENPSNFTCVESGSKTLKQKLFGTWCEVPDDTSNLPDVYTKTIDGDKYCDGVIDCELMGDDESHCTGEYYRFYCNSTRPGYISISEDKVCDGILDCVDGKDEFADICEVSGRPNRFPCPVRGGVMISIDSKNVCDFSINCDGGVDEMNCTDDRFYCENKDPLYVLHSQKRDGVGDCSDWSDECPTINQSTSIDAFSSRYELIESTVLRTIMWIMAFFAIIGNTAVIIREIIKIRSTKSKVTPAMRANRLLILNLAVADFLMGIYLLALCIMTVKMQGKYCSQDREWRASYTCVGLGVLSVVASETSVITMIILTGCRLYAVSKPFKSSTKPSPRHLFSFILGSWIASLILALLPLTPVLSRIFVNGVKFKHNPFATAISTPLENAKQMFSLMVLTNSQNISQVDTEELNSFLQYASWDDLNNEATKYFDINYFEPETYWGYYSTASVCIPKFFITRSDPAWVFSFIVTLFNFISFTFVVVAYVGIYFKSRKDVNVRGPQKNDEKNMKSMQRKILRLIVTDFCCWIPICIMAFSKLAGANVSDSAYAVAAIVLLPINSALNPLLYSDMVDAFYKKIKNSNHSQCSSQRTTNHSTKSTHFTKIEMIDRNLVIDGDRPSPAGSVM